MDNDYVTTPGQDRKKRLIHAPAYKHISMLHASRSIIVNTSIPEIFVKGNDLFCQHLLVAGHISCTIAVM